MRWSFLFRVGGIFDVIFVENWDKIGSWLEHFIEDRLD
jgi:hypothetical protein